MPYSPCGLAGVRLNQRGVPGSLAVSFSSAMPLLSVVAVALKSSAVVGVATGGLGAT